MADLPTNNPPPRPFSPQFPLHYPHLSFFPCFPYPTDGAVFIIPPPPPQGFIPPPYCAYASILPFPMTPYPYPGPFPFTPSGYGYPYLAPPSKMNAGFLESSSRTREREVQRQQNNVSAHHPAPVRRGTGVFHSPLLNHKNFRSNYKRGIGGRRNNKKKVNAEGSKNAAKREEGPSKQEECPETQVYLPDQDIALPNEWTY